MEFSKDKAKEKLNEWKGELEYLNLQMHLGAKEARDEFEELKGKVKEWSHAMDEKTDEWKESGSEHLTELKTKLEELRVQAALGRAEAADAFEEQKKNLNAKLHEVKHASRKVYENTGEKMSDLGDNIGEQASNFETRFDLLWLKLNLAKADASDVWEEKKKKMSYKFQEMQGKIDRQMDDLGDSWEGFSSEMKEAWSHVKSAFKS